MTNDKPIPEFFQNKDLRLILFGGKGGVGKTTMATTAAVQLARSFPNDKKVLVISTDPAHSLSDSFGIEIGDRVTPIQWSVVSGQRSEEQSQSSINNHQSSIQCPMSNVQCLMTNLFARELDAKKLLDGFKQKNDAVIKKLADRGTYFDQQDITDFFNLSLPGMDEVMAIIEVANLLRKGTYDILIVDTAPTGHTVRMLALPEQMLKWVEVMDLMQQKHRYMAVHFTRKKYMKDECDIFLENLSSDIDRVKKMLSNRETTRFVPVTIPETMSTYETKRLISSLEKMNVPMKEIIVNRIAPNNDCAFCRSRREDQKQYLIEIEAAFSKCDLVKVPLFPEEIRGVRGLRSMADYLIGVVSPSKPLKKIQEDKTPRSCLALNPELEFVLFGGKGGVGKTSLASAAALHLAQHNPAKKVLVFSTDPAHSLSDSFNQPVGDKITAVCSSPKSKDRSPKTGVQSPNLFALEIEADRLFEDFKEDYRKDIEKLFDKFMGGGVDIKFDRQVMTELLTLAPPGLDEVMALDRIMELREEGRFDLFVLDTSPTGHLLRFLELPDIIREWLNAFFRLLLKYKGVVRLAKAAEKALAMSKNVRRIQEALVDSQRTAFVAVTIPEAMGLLELERLVNALDNARIPCNHILINMVIPQMDCGFCSSKRVEQQGYIKKIRSKFSGHNFTELPLFPREVRGIDDLNKMAEIMFDNDK
ncbi:MAG: ArsA family ATPase [Deltaproteobacteria bacterium]|nr:ArsA family ATPase [Deltaproteobacteria bacterium]